MNRFDKAVASLQAGFTSESAKKDVLRSLSYHYQEMAGYEYNLAQIKQKHLSAMANTEKKAETIRCVELYAQIKAAPVVKPISKAEQARERLAAAIRDFGSCPDLDAALAIHKPKIAKEYEDYIRRIAEIMFEKYGQGLEIKREQVIRGNINYSNDNQYLVIVRGYCNAKEMGKDVFSKFVVYTLSNAKIARGSEKYADAVCEEFKNKIASKLGKIEDVLVRYVDTDGEFFVQGRKKGMAVEICQKIIINYSCHGLAFHQYPARIKVDGKAISEADFDEMMK